MSDSIARGQSPLTGMRQWCSSLARPFARASKPGAARNGSAEHASPSPCLPPSRPAHDLAHRLRWSQWPRQHQARARTSHY
ncbi:hypothetical protein GT031_16555 [Streptomyces sp. SID2888]|nr:hypothetical protein [Streptomyces sp. SID2888]